ncbi:hypothetical protein FNV43_RR16652 [Rhamnella rubrinervis]|uniref:Late embryogenesis abundant protein LEA-2 subgroup domain-containing protein n=1 Tax=Rhamnella rubrinervis TaxID=2594499 RepID=A0A8K0GZ81_9ROSA|nr:hypothetical protein FNV43_RR16652 [Rhamnella rubrinervis]
MASSSEDQPKKPSDDYSNMNQGHHHSGGYSPAVGYPPTMGYPNGQNGYPPPPPPQYHQGYPPQPYNHYGHYNQPHHPPHPYYVSESQSSNGSAFIRGFLIMLIILVTITCVSSIIVWMILRPETPVFKLETLAVSNFNSSTSHFSANWDSNITVENPNHKLKVYFDRIHSFVYYREDFMSSAAADPLLIPTKGHHVMKLKMATNNSDEHVVGNWVMEDIVRQRNSGTVSFNIRLLIYTTFKSGGWWTRQATLKVFCDDKKVNFVGNETNGVLIGGNNSQCDVYYS